MFESLFNKAVGLKANISNFSWGHIKHFLEIFEYQTLQLTTLRTAFLYTYPLLCIKVYLSIYLSIYLSLSIYIYISESKNNGNGK